MKRLVGWLRSLLKSADSAETAEWKAVLLAAAVVGVVGIVAFAAQFSGTDVVSVATSGVIIGGASGLGGALLGFLFGIPKSTAKATDGSYQPNTNLEEISDWLTKILVGVGLVQLGRATKALGKFAKVLAPAFGGRAASAGFGLAVVVYFAVCGFLLSYLWTRIQLTPELQLADLVDKRIDQKADQQNQSDAAALSTVNRQLSPPGGATSQPTPDDIADAVTKASAPVKVQIFQAAVDTRRTGWRNQDSAVMERSEPVFRALISADSDQRFHRNFAQLGYVLKDKTPADLPGALQMLSKAIEIRDKLEPGGWALYEFNRAIVRIRQDPTVQGQSATDVRATIVADLKVAAKDPYVRTLLAEDPIPAWRQRNQVTDDELGLSAPAPPAASTGGSSATVAALAGQAAAPPQPAAGALAQQSEPVEGREATGAPRSPAGPPTAPAQESPTLPTRAPGDHSDT